MSKYIMHGLKSRNASPLERKVYQAWNDIKMRCYVPTHHEYHRYGARGIRMQESWLQDPRRFYEYVAGLDNFSQSRSLDRVDNDVGYYEGNLRWATCAEQVRNRGKNNNNSSGSTGVTWYYNKTGGTRAIAWWFDGRQCSKSFSVGKYGLLPAFKLACEYRTSMIEKMNNAGAGYSDKHGKERKESK